MPITEGNPVAVADPPAAQAPVVQIDYGAIGSAVADSLKNSGLMQPQTLQPAQSISAFQEAIKAIEANPDNDKESLATISKLFEAHKADLSKESERRISDMLVRERVRQGQQILDAEINRVTEADEDLAGLAPAVRVLAIQEFDTAKEYEADRVKLASGEDIQQVVRKLVTKKFSELSGSKKKPQAGLTGMQTQGTSPAAAASAAQPAATKVEDLNERQRELFYSIVSEQERVGLKQIGKTKAEVEADAMKRASAKFKT